MRTVTRRWYKRGAALLALLVAGIAIGFYVFFICGVPLLWPYYVPQMAGARIIDPSAWFFPRGNMAPFARYPLGPQGQVNVFSTCYPLVSPDGFRHCSIRMRFDVADRTDVRFVDTPVVVTAPDGTDLVDLDRYRDAGEIQRSSRGANRLEDGQLYLTYSDFMSSAYVPLSTKVGSEYTVRFPKILYAGREISLPPVVFRRVDNLTCTGIFSNF